jgi:hypothetical protein
MSESTLQIRVVLNAEIVMAQVRCLVAIADPDTPRHYRAIELSAFHALSDLQRMSRKAAIELGLIKEDTISIDVNADEMATHEAARLRAGLQWYADGKHMMGMEAWDDEEGWLCGFDDDGAMVEPGRVAKAILKGKMLNPDEDDDLICIEAKL